MKKTVPCILMLIMFFMMNDLFACTAFYARDGKMVLAGINEDWISAESYLWFCPPEEGKYGRLYFGFNLFLDNNEPFGGINDHGLFFQAVLARGIAAKADIAGESYHGNLLERILEECSSVEEVTVLLGRYNNLQYYSNTHILVGDKHGNAIIIELGRVIKRNSPFLILPNDIENMNPCDQYTITHKALSDDTALSIDLFRRILSNVHVEGTMGSATTVYSAIYDLIHGKVHLYYFHNFVQEVVLDLGHELKKGPRVLATASLFPQNIAAEDYADMKLKEVKERTIARMSTNITQSDYDVVTGKFASVDPTSKDEYDIVMENQKLFVVTKDRARFELLPQSTTKFFIPSVNGEFTVTFLNGDQGRGSELLAEYEFLGIRQMFRKVE